MKSKYAYLIWLTIMLTSWLSALLSVWVAMVIDYHYLPFSLFWFIIVVVVAIIPNIKSKNDS